MAHNAPNTSNQCSIFQDFSIAGGSFTFFFNPISPNRFSKCALQDIRVLLLIPIALTGVHKGGKYCIHFLL